MKKILSRFIKFLIRVCLHLNLHFLFAFLIMKITGINNSGAKEGIIVFGRISSDLELLTKSKKYNYFYLHRLQFFIPSIFLDREIMSQKKYFDATDRKSQEQKQQLEKHLLKLLKYFKEKANVKYIFAASYNFFEHQEWANAGKELGIELIIYYKEGVLADGRIDGAKFYIEEDAKKIKNVDKVLVYGETGYKHFVNTNLVDNSQIYKVGSLKADELYKNLKISNSNSNKNKKTITLFAFPAGEFPKGFDANSYYSQQWHAGYWCPNLWKETINEFAKLSNKFTNYEFLVKTKSPPSTELVKSFIDVENIDNLVFSDEITTSEVCQKSNLVIAFNSTVLIEVLSTDVNCLVPQWHEALDPIFKDKLFLTETSKGYNSVHSAMEFNKFISSLIVCDFDTTDLKNDRKSRQSIVNYYLEAVDGNVMKRIHQVLNGIS